MLTFFGLHCLSFENGFSRENPTERTLLLIQQMEAGLKKGDMWFARAQLGSLQAQYCWLGGQLLPSSHLLLSCFLGLSLAVPTSPWVRALHSSSHSAQGGRCIPRHWKLFGKRKRTPLLACSWSHITFSCRSIGIHIHSSLSLQKIEESVPYAWTVE